jgi:hypothetical protein
MENNCVSRQRDEINSTCIYFSLIPSDSEVPPQKPSDIGESGTPGHHSHAEHAMSLTAGKNYLIAEMRSN